MEMRYLQGVGGVRVIARRFMFGAGKALRALLRPLKSTKVKRRERKLSRVERRLKRMKARVRSLERATGK